MERYRPDISAWRAFSNLCLSEASFGQGVGVRSSGDIVHCIDSPTVNQQSYSVRLSLLPEKRTAANKLPRDIISNFSSLARLLVWRQLVPGRPPFGHSNNTTGWTRLSRLIVTGENWERCEPHLGGERRWCKLRLFAARPHLRRDVLAKEEPPYFQQRR